MLQDLRFAFRLLRRSPGFAVAAILTLTLGIGATTAIFTLVDAVLLRPLDLGAPDRVVALQQTTQGYTSTAFLYSDYQKLRAAVGPAINLAIEYHGELTIETPAGLARRRGGFVSTNYFDVLERRPVAGRPFVEADDEPGAEPVIVITDAFWRSVLAGDAGAVGRTVRISGVPMTIVGIAPPRVRGTNIQSVVDIFLPAHAVLRTTTMPGTPGNYFFQDGSPGWSPSPMWHLFGRLAPGASTEAAAGKAICAGCAAQKLQLIPIQQAAVASRIRNDVSRFSLVLFIAVCCVLLIGCANLAGLVMARTESRRREIAVRLAMGISRGRLIRQLLWECALIAVASSVAGLVLARWILAGISTFELPGLIRLDKLQYALDLRILGFAVALSAIAAVAFGLGPARAAARADIVRSLKQVRGSGGTGRSHYALIAVQIAFTVVLVIGAGLFIRSLKTALAVDVGLDVSRVVIADTDVQPAKFDPARKVAYFEAAVSQLASLPSVASVSYGNGPFFAFGGSTPALQIDGQKIRLPQNVNQYMAGPGYFRTLGIPLTRGREFTAADDASAPAVVVINTAFARRFWPDSDPIGHRISALPSIKDAVVVGVVEDGKYQRLDETGRLAIFSAWKQGGSLARSAAVIVRTHGDAGAAARGVGDIVKRIDSQVATLSVLPLQEIIGRGLQPQRLGFWLLGSFGTVGVVLGIVGIYGLVTFIVAQRTHEIGVRMALGARSRDVMRAVLAGLMVAVVGGALAGVGAAWVLAGFVNRLLFGIGPHDPVAFAGALALLFAAAIAGSWFPARRATRVDPMTALRAE
jgi:putative ABC transport system permease protein